MIVLSHTVNDTTPKPHVDILAIITKIREKGNKKRDGKKNARKLAE